MNRNARAVRTETAQDVPCRTLAAAEEEMEGKVMESEEGHHRQLLSFTGSVNRNSRVVRTETVADVPRRVLATEEEEN